MDKRIKLLIVCQKVESNDDLLGFFHGWIEELAKHCERVIVICLYKGEYNLPTNVIVLSLGKERNFKFFKKTKYFLNFFHHIWAERKNYDSVFVHMNFEYVVLAGWWWRLAGKKIILWHAHKAVNWKLRLSEKLVNIIVTSTKSGCRLESKKIRIVGQGIDVEKFKVQSSPLKVDLPLVEKFKVNEEIFKIISVGRISPIKDYETFINAIELVKQRGIVQHLKVKIIGSPARHEDDKYLEKLNVILKEKGLDDIFEFIGSVPHKNIISYLQNADLFINTSLTGSLDKAVLEAMACGLPILTCNEAYMDVLGIYRERLMFPKGDAKLLADKIFYLMNIEMAEREKMISDSREIVVKNHSLNKLISTIVSFFQ